MTSFSPTKSLTVLGCLLATAIVAIVMAAFAHSSSIVKSHSQKAVVITTFEDNGYQAVVKKDRRYFVLPINQNIFDNIKVGDSLSINQPK